jgi:hypothetical protein
MSAAFGGQLSVLHWLRANGCPWDERACPLAAEVLHSEFPIMNACLWYDDSENYLDEPFDDTWLDEPYDNDVRVDEPYDDAWDDASGEGW